MSNERFTDDAFTLIRGDDADKTRAMYAERLGLMPEEEPTVAKSVLKTLPIQDAINITEEMPDIQSLLFDLYEDDADFVEMGVENGRMVVRAVDKMSPTSSSVHVPTTEWNEDDKPFIHKAADEELRYTFSPWYVPDVLDAHGEWTDRDEVQQAFWKYLARDNRDIRLQHNVDIVAGRWVEGATFPYPVTFPIKHPEGDREYTFPAGTPFLGVIWEPWAWQMIKSGEIRGLSIGGTGKRMTAELEESNGDVAGAVSFTAKMIAQVHGKYVVFDDEMTRSFGVYGTEEEAKDRLAQIERLSSDKTKDAGGYGGECPPATQDIELNLENRQKAIDDVGYGPLNPAEPNEEFWQNKADRWKTTIKEAKASLCGTCVFFVRTPQMLDCIEQGIGLGNQEAEGSVEAGELGYCNALDFKCASERTCDAWAAGGPITEESQLDKAKDVETGDFVRWNSGTGVAQGKVTRVVRDGKINVPDSSFSITGTEDNPALLIRIYQEGEDGWERTETQVGHRSSTVRSIQPLEKQESFTPPQGVQEEAQRALNWMAEGEAGDNFTDVGRRRASQLANGQKVSIDTMRRMASFLARHEDSSKGGQGFNQGDESYPSAGRVSWAAWGGDPAKSWVESTLARYED